MVASQIYVISWAFTLFELNIVKTSLLDLGII